MLLVTSPNLEGKRNGKEGLQVFPWAGDGEHG